jgi:MFS family permease
MPLPRKVRTLLYAQIASQMGDAAFGVLLLWTVLGLTENRAVAGGVAMMNYLPVLLFGLVGGLAADRLPRRGLMVASDAVRGTIALSLTGASLAGALSPWTLAVGGFLLFTASAFFNPARDAFIPSLVEARDLVRANALIQLSIPAGWLFGPALCSLCLAWVKADLLFAGVGALFFISVLFLAGLPRALPAEVGHAPAARAIFEGLQVAWKDVRLRWLLAITAVDNLLIMGPAIVGTPILVKDVLHAGGPVYALMEALLALGVFAGLPLTTWLNKRLGQGKIVIAGIFLDGLTYLPLLWLKGTWGVGLAIALHGLSIPLITVTRASLVQRIAPPQQMGRIFALISITVIGLTALSSGLTGLAVGLLPVNVIFGIIAVLAALCGPAAWLSREFREA